MLNGQCKMWVTIRLLWSKNQLEWLPPCQIWHPIFIPHQNLFLSKHLNFFYIYCNIVNYDEYCFTSFIKSVRSQYSNIINFRFQNLKYRHSILYFLHILMSNTDNVLLKTIRVWRPIGTKLMGRWRLMMILWPWLRNCKYLRTFEDGWRRIQGAFRGSR